METAMRTSRSGNLLHSFLPLGRLWLSLWAYCALVSSCAVVIVFSAAAGFSIAFPSESMTSQVVKDMEDDSALLSELLKAGVDDPKVVMAVEEYFVSKNEKEEKARRNEKPYDSGWSLLGWSFGSLNRNGTRQLAGTADSSEYRERLEKLIAETLSSGEVRKIFERTFYMISIPVTNGNETLGAFAFGTSLEGVSSHAIFSFYSALIPSILLLFGSGGLFAGGILTIRIGRTIRRLRIATEGFLKGKFSTAGVKGEG